MARRDLPLRRLRPGRQLAGVRRRHHHHQPAPVGRQENSMTMATIEPVGGVPLPASDTTRSLVEWASELEAAGRIGKALCGTSFVPAAFRGKPEEAAAAILTGAAMGLPPTTALQMFFVIN